jgi:NAD+ kinase
MRIRRVLVVHRKSLYQIYIREHHERSVEKALRARDTVALGLKESDAAHEASLAKVRAVLDKLGLEAEVRWRANARSSRRFDLVISLGGDGTVLDTSRKILDATPLLGINSDPKRSVGALCTGTASDLPALLEDLTAGRLRPSPLTRIRVRIAGHDVLGPVLNDVLFAHVCPAGLTRFDLAVVDDDEALAAHSGHGGVAFAARRGSGIWVATATGSTAALRSAGGRVLPPRSHALEYVLREPYTRPGVPRPAAAERRVVVPPGRALVLVCRMRQGMLWADGQYRRQAVSYSQPVVLDRHPQDLLIVRRR